VHHDPGLMSFLVSQLQAQSLENVHRPRTALSQLGSLHCTKRTWSVSPSLYDRDRRLDESVNDGPAKCMGTDVYLRNCVPTEIVTTTSCAYYDGQLMDNPNLYHTQY
jgi:hypothetical protein